MREWMSAVMVGSVATAAAAVDIPTYSDRTSDAGLSFLHATTQKELIQIHKMTPGVGVGDFNRDGALDLFVQGGAGQNARLYINDGSGSFTDEAAAWSIDVTSAEGSSVGVADVDGNGYLDILAASVLGRNYLFLNTGLGGFVETGVAANVAYVEGVPVPTFGVTFGDIDLDGDLDFARSEWQAGLFTGIDGNRLFTNNGSAAFTDITDGAGTFEEGELVKGFAPALVDLNGDFLPELTVAADFFTSKYFANAGGNLFLDLTDGNGNGTGTDENGMGSALGDYDNDGDLDWFVTSIWDEDGAEGSWGVTGNRLYRNEGNHQFTDVTDLAGVRAGYWGWGAGFGDLNNDGLLDLSMTNGFVTPNGSNPDPTFLSDPTRVWLNTGDFTTGPTYVESSVAAGVIDTGNGKGLVTFDADNDGDLDLLISSNHQNLLYFRNDSDPGADRWIELDLVSPPGNAPDGHGAKVSISVGGQTYHRTVFGSPSFISQDPLRLHFGFPAASTIDVVTVEWPDGLTSVRTDVPSGQVLCFLRSDLDLDGVVGVGDLLELLSRWGLCAAPCPGDDDAGGTVDTVDLIRMLSDWGGPSYCGN